MATTQPITTAQQLFEARDLGRCELVRGELIMMTPAGIEHSRIAARIIARLEPFVDERHLGSVTGADGGFRIERDPDTVRVPDVGFIGKARMPAEPVRAYFQGAPDLAVEVLSPDDRAGEVLAKVQEWLAAGCRLVWVVDPIKRTVSICRPDKPWMTLSERETLSGDDIVPGFSVPVAEIFAR